MKKVFVLAVVFLIIFSSLVHAYPFTPEEFIDEYPNPYIYRVDLPTGESFYFSSPAELIFEMEDLPASEGGGKMLVVLNPSGEFYMRLKPNGYPGNTNKYRLEIMPDEGGYTGPVAVYIWDGERFFLPWPLEMRKALGGMTQAILPTGFGILSASLLVKLLTFYFKRYMHRSL